MSAPFIPDPQRDDNIDMNEFPGCLAEPSYIAIDSYSPTQSHQLLLSHVVKKDPHSSLLCGLYPFPSFLTEIAVVIFLIVTGAAM